MSVMVGPRAGLEAVVELRAGGVPYPASSVGGESLGVTGVSPVLTRDSGHSQRVLWSSQSTCGTG